MQNYSELVFVFKIIQKRLLNVENRARMLNFSLVSDSTFRNPEYPEEFLLQLLKNKKLLKEILQK